VFIKGLSHKIITPGTATTAGTPSTARKLTTAMTPEMIKITVEQVTSSAVLATATSGPVATPGMSNSS
jgi:hypothetical protein